jgi:hypothetical protein
MENERLLRSGLKYGGQFVKTLARLIALLSLATAAYAGTVTGPMSSVIGDSAPWSNATGTTVVDGGGPCNVIAYGADPTGAADSYSAIQTAWTTAGCSVLYFPPGTYKLGTAISGPSTDGAGWIGAGQFATTIKASFTTGDMVTSAAFINHPVFKGMTLTRASAATSGCGLQMNTSNNYAIVDDLYITNQFNGLCLQGTGFSSVSHVNAVSNANYGVDIEWPSPSGNALQWQLFDIFAGSNASDGIHINASGTGSGAVSTGQYRALATFNNGGYGVYLNGLAQIRMSDSFFGSDKLSEVYVAGSTNTQYAHVFTNVSVESSQTGYGFNFQNTNKSPVSLVNCDATNNNLAGAFFYQQNVTVTGGEFQNNGAGGNSYGLYAYSSGNLSSINVNAAQGGNQTFGFVSGGGVSVQNTIGSHGNIACSATTCNSADNW